jgi:ketosteroid isomerase-like protein
MQPLATEIESLRAIYDGINRNDISAAVAPLAEDIAWIEPAEYTGSATCHGRANVAAHLIRARATWAEGSCEPEQFLVIGDKVVVTIHVHVRLKTETAFRDGRHAAVYTFRNGQAIEMRIIDDPQQAIEWANAKGSTLHPPTPAKLY